MKFYVFNEKKELVEATEDQIKNLSIALYNKDGEIIREAKSKVEAPEIKATETNSEDRITEIMKEISVSLSGLNKYKEKVEELDEKVAKYQEAEKRGFILPNGEIDEKKATEFAGPKFYKTAFQGKLLEDKYRYNYQPEADKKKELSDWLCLVTEAGVLKDLDAHKEIRQRWGSVFGRNEKTGTVGIGDSGNTFVVPDIIDEMILFYAREKSIALQEATIVPMTSEKQSWPIESTGVSFNWSNTTSESTPTVSEFELDADEVSAYAEVRNTTLADSRSDIVSWLTGLMVNELGQELDNQMINGTGTPCSGILTAACGKSVQMGQAAFSNITATHLSEMIAQLDGVRKEGAKFYFNGAVFHYVRDLKDSQNRPIFIDVIGGTVPPMILGFPFRESVKHPSTSAESTAFGTFGNLRNFYLGRRLQTATLEINQVASTPFLTNRTWFKLYNRWALGIALPNGLVRLITGTSS